MATRNIRTIQAAGLTASADLSSYQYCAVDSAGSNTVALETSAGASILGVLQNAPTANLPAEVDVLGVTKVKFGDTVAAGADIMVEATTGRFVTATTGNYAVGKAINGGADGEIGEAVLYGNSQLN
jgi:hypothetical protein